MYSPMRALLLAFVASLGFALMTLHVKRLSGELVAVELLFVRSSSILVLTTAWAFFSKLELFPQGRRILVIRGLLGASALFCFFYAIQRLPMLMIATVVEGRLMQINPYGQPGVEGYKVNMKKELGI